MSPNPHERESVCVRERERERDREIERERENFYYDNQEVTEAEEVPAGNQKRPKKI